LATDGKSPLALEQHIKGIAFKLLRQMCYIGGGIGKHSKGIVNPIKHEVQLVHAGLRYYSISSFNESHLGTFVMFILQEPTPTFVA
jgi:hypothetical protein